MTNIVKFIFVIAFVATSTAVFATNDTPPTTIDLAPGTEDMPPATPPEESPAPTDVAPNTSSGVQTGVGVPTGIDEDGNIETKTGFTSFMDYMSTLFAFALKLGAALTALMVIYAGFKYLTSQGNPTATGEAKEIIIGSLSGFAMLLLVYLILNVLGFPTPN